MKTLLSVIFGFLFVLKSSISLAQVVTAASDTITVFDKNKDTTILFFDPSKLSPIEFSNVYTALSEVAIKNHFTKTYTVQGNDNIERVIKNTYNIVDEKDHHISQVLKQQLQKLNGLNAQMTIVKGSTISLPKLPVKRSDQSTKGFVQYFDFYNNKSYFSSAKAIANSVPSSIPTPQNFRSAALVAVKMTPSDLVLFKSMLTKKGYRQLYGRGMVSLDSIKKARIWYLADKKFPVVPGIMPVDSAVFSILKGLKKNNFGTYYVFDSFNGHSDHGQKVIDVINDRFVAYGLDTVGISIKKIPVNFFENLADGKKLLLNYYQPEGDHDLPAVEQTHELKILNVLDSTARSFVNCDDCIPEIYLSALFRYYYKLKPDVISSSFWADMFDRNIMPHRSYSNTSLVTAGLNTNDEIEQKLRNVLEDEDLLTASVQPIYDYFIAYPEDGCMIIGNRIKQATAHGSWGKHVTTLGQGIGWNGTAIRDTDSGTSFATPDVAAKLFIAKAYWRSKLDTPSAREARLRVLLATDLDTAFVGRYESAGTVNMVKLLQTGNYAELLSGEIVKVTGISVKDAIVGLPDGETQKFRRRTVIKGKTYDGICGLAYCDGRFYSFSEAEPVWEPLYFQKINLTITTEKGAFPITTQKDFYSTFKQLVILKNP